MFYIQVHNVRIMSLFFLVCVYHFLCGLALYSHQEYPLSPAIAVNETLKGNSFSKKQEITIQKIQKLRKSSDFNIVMDYSHDMQWNPLYSYTVGESQILIGLFEGLLSYDPKTLQPKPALAKRWVHDAESMRYTFYLRENAQFNNGDPIDANTIYHTWIHLIQNGDQALFSSLLDNISGVTAYRKGTIPLEKLGIQVLSPYQLEITLNGPSPEILNILCHSSLSPLHPSLLKQGGKVKINKAAKELLISNGPYRIQSIADVGLTFQKSRTYWDRENVLSEEIFIQKYQDWQNLEIITALSHHKIDWIASSVNLRFEMLNNKKHIANLLHIQPSFGTTFLYISSHLPEIEHSKLEKITKALAMLLPIENLRKIPDLEKSFLVPGFPKFEFTKKIERQEVENGKALLKSLGYPNGKGLGSLQIILPTSKFYDNLINQIQGSWKDLDCNLLISRENTTIHPQKKQKESSSFSLQLFTWVGDYPDPTSFLNLWRSNNPLSIFHYKNPKFDHLLDAAQKSMNYKKRLQLLAQAEELLLQYGAVIPLQYIYSENLLNEYYLEGFSHNILDIHPLQYLHRINPIPKWTL